MPTPEQDRGAGQAGADRVERAAVLHDRAAPGDRRRRRRRARSAPARRRPSTQPAPDLDAAGEHPLAGEHLDAGAGGRAAAAVDLDQQLADGERAGHAGVGQAELRDGARAAGPTPTARWATGTSRATSALPSPVAGGELPGRRPPGRSGRRAAAPASAGQHEQGAGHAGRAAGTVPDDQAVPGARRPAPRRAAARRARRPRGRRGPRPVPGARPGARLVGSERASRDTVPPSVASSCGPGLRPRSSGARFPLRRRPVTNRTRSVVRRRRLCDVRHTGALPSGERSTSAVHLRGRNPRRRR